MNINQYPLEQLTFQDESYYDIDFWTGSEFVSKKILGSVIKAGIQQGIFTDILDGIVPASGGGTVNFLRADGTWTTPPAIVNIYNSDGTLTSTRFVTLDGNILVFTELTGDTTVTGNEIQVRANAGSEALLTLVAGNDQKRSLRFTDNIDLRWELTTEIPEIGGDTGTDLVLYSFDDAGILIDEILRINRSTGVIKLNNAYELPNFDGTVGQVLTTDGAGVATWQSVGGNGIGNVVTASSQWSKTLPAPVSLLNGSIANGFTFFDNIIDKVANGTTPYYEFNIDYGITIQLSGTSGSANINVNGVNYLATYTVSLFQTALNWVNANKATLNALGINVFALGISATDGRIRFGSPNETLLNNITITNVVSNLSGVLSNEFTGLPNAKNDHIRVQYNGEPIDGQRLLHTIRANFNISIGSVQYAELRLYRYADNSVIGSGVTIQRNPDETGQQVVIETYTGGALDAFVTGGFYIGLANNTGTTLDFINSAGILIQTVFQKPTLF